MDILTNAEGFDWGEGNISKSSEKHRVSPSECEEIFFNSPLIVHDDMPHSKTESRYFALGKTDSSRLLFVVFTIRKRKIRIISARDMSRKERQAYNEKTQEDTEI